MQDGRGAQSKAPLPLPLPHVIESIPTPLVLGALSPKPFTYLDRFQKAGLGFIKSRQSNKSVHTYMA